MGLPVQRPADTYLARQGSGEYKHITREEASRLAAGASTEQTRLKVKLLWATGARVSEVICQLRVEDLDVERSILRIRRLKRRKEFVQEVPITLELANELRLFVRSKGRRGRIFSGDRTSTFEVIRNLGRRVLGRGISPKHFRHGKAYHLVRVKGVHPVVAARALGHATMNSILSYGHPTEADLREAMED